MTMTNEKANDRQEIENLLPWHAAGTLNRRDAERVEHALARDEELARRFEMVREELAETIHLNESLGAPSARAMEKLFAAIDAEGALKRKTGFAFDLRTHVAEFLAGFAPRTETLEMLVPCRGTHLNVVGNAVAGGKVRRGVVVVSSLFIAQRQERDPRGVNPVEDRRPFGAAPRFGVAGWHVALRGCCIGRHALTSRLVVSHRRVGGGPAR